MVIINIYNYPELKYINKQVLSDSYIYIYI